MPRSVYEYAPFDGPMTGRTDDALNGGAMSVPTGSLAWLIARGVWVAGRRISDKDLTDGLCDGSVRSLSYSMERETVLSLSGSIAVRFYRCPVLMRARSLCWTNP